MLLLFLPLDILTEILSELSVEELLSMSLTCVYLHYLCMFYLQKIIDTHTSGPWSGCRIICAGDYMDELPPNVEWTAEQKKRVAEGFDGLFTQLNSRGTLQPTHVLMASF
jgi:hypothetical protein